MNVNPKHADQLREEMKISLAKKIETLKPEKRMGAVKAELDARRALAALAMYFDAQELSVTIDGQEYEFINKGIEKRKDEAAAKKVRQAKAQAEFEAAKAAELEKASAEKMEDLKDLIGSAPIKEVPAKVTKVAAREARKDADRLEAKHIATEGAIATAVVQVIRAKTTEDKFTAEENLREAKINALAAHAKAILAHRYAVVMEQAAGILINA